MHFYYIALTFWAMNVLVSTAFASEIKGHEHGSHEECELPKSANDILSCALSYNPQAKRDILGLEVVSKLKDQAKQVPNPTLTARYVESNASAIDSSELEANLSFTLELGGKRAARIEKAKAQESEYSAYLEAGQVQIKMSTILNLYRLRQALDEDQMLDDSIIAFSKVIKQLSSLAKLSFNQEAALALFQIALEEAKIEKSQLNTEIKELAHFFHISTGHSIAEIKPFLPGIKKDWPNSYLRSSSHKPVKSSPNLKQLKALSLSAQKEYELQKSGSWPDLKIGPSLLVESSGNRSIKNYGLAIQIPIPIFNRNEGGRAHAMAELTKARKNIDLAQGEETHERYEQLLVLKNSVATLNSTLDSASILKKQKKLESLFNRGVLDNSTYLDSHKQRNDYLRARNRSELAAVRSLWNLYKADGEVLEKEL